MKTEWITKDLAMQRLEFSFMFLLGFLAGAAIAYSLC